MLMSDNHLNSKRVLEQIMPSYMTSIKIGIRQIRIAFALIFCMRIINKPSELCYNAPKLLVQMCTQSVFAYMVATSLYRIIK